MDKPVKMGLRELWSSRLFRVQVYLAIEVAILVIPLSYIAAENFKRSAPEQTTSNPIKSNLFMEARQ